MQSVVRNTAFAALPALVAPAAGGAETLQLFAAGSLKAARGETAATHKKANNTKG